MVSRYKRRLLDLKTPSPLFCLCAFDEYMHHCWYCGGRLAFSKQGRQGPTGRSIDHISPINRGRNRLRRDDSGFKVPACRHCNEMKGNMSLEEFRGEFSRCNSKLFYGERREQELQNNA